MKENIPTLEQSTIKQHTVEPVNYSELKREKMKEKTGFEPTQELPLSDKDIQLILDTLHHAIRSIDKAIGESREMLTKEIITSMIERQNKIQLIINKLNGTPV